jgi:hypothetical protein
MAAAKAKIDENWVTVHLPKALKGQQNFQLVTVNGKSYKVLKGEAVKVPREVAEVLLNSDIAKDEADTFIEAILN